MPLPIALVRSLLKKKGRREHGLFVLEGPSLLEEALDSRIPVREVRVAAEAAGAPIVARAAAAGIPIVSDSDRSLAKLSDLDTPPGLLAVAPTATQPLLAVLATQGPVVLLAGIADPGNAGTLIRAAEAFGAGGIVFGTGSVEPYHPKVVRAAMGSMFRLPHAVAEPEELLEAASHAGRPVVALDRSGTPLEQFDFPRRPLLAVGGERHGVGAWLPRWDAAVGIPHAGPTESLNAGVAGAIVLYEWSRRRRTSV
jgi:TrmH family RNA methyltransferase